MTRLNSVWLVLFIFIIITFVIAKLFFCLYTLFMLVEYRKRKKCGYCEFCGRYNAGCLNKLTFVTLPHISSSYCIYITFLPCYIITVKTKFSLTNIVNCFLYPLLVMLQVPVTFFQIMLYQYCAFFNFSV